MSKKHSYLGLTDLNFAFLGEISEKILLKSLKKTAIFRAKSVALG